jgi:hypothetical protein
MEEGYYNVYDQQLIGQPNVQPAYLANITMNIEGEDLNFHEPVKYRFTDPVRGELYQPLVVIPAVTINDFNSLYLKIDKEKEIELSFTANKTVKIPSLTASQTFDSRSDTLPLLVGGFSLNKRQTYIEDFKDKSLDEKVYKINVAPDYQHGGYILKSVNYGHIPSINYFKEAILTVKNIDVKTVGKRIGYIVGAGDKVPEALEQMGFNVTLLGNKELSRNNLQQFDAIITGVRAYNTNEWMNNYYDKLMRYVKDGGNLIVQYNTSNQSGSGRAKIGPYDFTISRTRVTVENAPVTFLKPAHSVLSFPNKITQEDFKGWIQERSTYHATDLDKNYETIFSMNDPGEKPDEGSLIIGRYGKGTFVYTGLVFFRELPAGVPGAYRLMANLIALNKQKAF